MTWLFRVGGVLLLIFGGGCVLVGLIGDFDPQWSRAVYLLGGVLAMASGGFHTIATVSYSETEDWD